MTVKVNFKGLEKLLKTLDNIPKAKVGVLSSENSREGEESNASIGYKHEFGIGVPKRSFIRDPLIQNFKEKLSEAGFSEDTLKEAIDNGSLENVIEKMGLVGVATIQDAFNTGFNGQWEPTKRPNNTGMTLVDTQQLRNSIISEVESV